MSDNILKSLYTVFITLLVAAAGLALGHLVVAAVTCAIIAGVCFCAAMLIMVWTF